MDMWCAWVGRCEPDAACLDGQPGFRPLYVVLGCGLGVAIRGLMLTPSSGNPSIPPAFMASHAPIRQIQWPTMARHAEGWGSVEGGMHVFPALFLLPRGLVDPICAVDTVGRLMAVPRVAAIMPPCTFTL